MRDPWLDDGPVPAGCLRVIVGAALAVILAALSLSTCEEPLPASSSGYRVPSSTNLIPSIGLEITTTSSSSTTTTAVPVPPPSTRVAEPEHSSRGGGRGEDLGTFRVTCYGPPLFPAGQKTATGAPVGPGSIAVDPAVIRLGTKLEVAGYGRGVANDTGSKVKGRHVDVWVADPSPCPYSRARVVRA